MKNLPIKPIDVATLIPLSKQIPSAAAEASVKEVINAWSDYKKTVELETTKRTAIKGWRDTKLAEINSQKEILEIYLRETFKERSVMIGGLFEALDKGLDTGNDQVIGYAMNAIIGIANTSPLAGAKEIVQAMRDPNVRSIEI